MRALPVPSLLACVLLAGTTNGPLLAQTPKEIVDHMLEAYADNAEGVDNYTLVQDMMGFETTMYFEKEMVEGRPVFHARIAGARGMADAGGGGEDAFGELYASATYISEHARYEGREEVDSHATHVLAIDDLSGLDFDGAGGSQAEDFTPRTGKLFIDAELWIPRRMEFAGDLKTDDGTHEVTSVMSMEEYRVVEGFLHPFRTVIRIEGLGGAIDPEARAQLEELRRQLEEVPEAQRAMVERMMGGQMERLEAMMGGDDGGMTVDVTVKELRINEGPPEF